MLQSNSASEAIVHFFTPRNIPLLVAPVQLTISIVNLTWMTWAWELTWWSSHLSSKINVVGLHGFFEKERKKRQKKKKTTATKSSAKFKLWRLSWQVLEWFYC
jgi:hypothetical protein